MAIKVMTEFIRKATIRVICYIYDDDEALVNATSVDISIIDPDGTAVVDEAAMSNAAGTGIYEYYYTTTTAVIQGNYQIECDITDSSYHTYVHGHFSLVSGINE